MPILKWLRRSLPETRTILGLRDIMDDAETVRKDWSKKGVYEALENLYNEVWVYGIREFYDPIQEYAIPKSVQDKIYFTGYIPRKVPDKKALKQIRKEHRLKEGEKLVVVTAGRGGDGYLVMDTFLSMLERESSPPPFKSVLITGPFMREKIFALLEHP